MSKQPAPKKMFHFLVCGEIIFKPKDMDDQVGGVRLNAAIVSHTQDLPARMLGRAQQALQMMFFKRQDINTVDVLDVVIVNLVHLGYMTEEEFQAAPDGTQLQEQAQAVVDTAKTSSNKPGLKVVGKSETLPKGVVEKESEASRDNPFGLSPEELASMQKDQAQDTSENKVDQPAASKGEDPTTDGTGVA